MTSTSSTYTNKIDVTFPTPGKNNDSQGFRDNFANIFQALTYVNSDVSNLIKNSVTTTTPNDFNTNVIKRATFQNCSEYVNDKGLVAQGGNITIDYSLGSFQKYLLEDGEVDFTIINWPANLHLGKIKLQCIPQNVGTTYINFVGSNIVTIGDSTVLPETLSGPTFYEIWSSDNGVTTYVSKVGTKNAVVGTGTDITAYNSLTINSNRFTRGQNYSTTVAYNSGTTQQYGSLAVLPNRITATITGTDITTGVDNHSYVYVDSSIGIFKSATLRVDTTSQIYTIVDAPIGTQLRVTPQLATETIPTVPITATFTNVSFVDQPVVSTYVSSITTTTDALIGNETVLQGQISANSTTLYISYRDGDSFTPNLFKVTADSVPLDLPDGTTAVTQPLSDASTKLANTEFVNLSINSVNSQVNGLIQPGFIILWYGSYSTIPAGWKICDGGTYNNYTTPNLKDRFVVGGTNDYVSAPTFSTTGSAITSYSTDSVGGSADAVLLKHTHSILDPGHQHLTGWGEAYGNPYGLGGGGHIGSNKTDFDNNEYKTSINNTGITVVSTGTVDTLTNKNLPPYYALYYIMFVGYGNTYTISGTISGLTNGSVTLSINNTYPIIVSQNGAFVFPNALPTGTPYAITVMVPPSGQNCTVTGGSSGGGAGTISNANVTDIVVTCATNSYTISGTVTGLGSGKSVILKLNGSNSLTVSTNGAFSFTTSILSGSTYSVTVGTQPTGQTASVINGAGTILGSNINNVIVNCV